MIDDFGYNLTQYKSFRQLQFSYTKLKNEHELLQSQVTILAQNYQQKCKDVLELKKQGMEQKIKLKNKNLKYKKLYRELIEHIQTSLNLINPNNQSDQQQLNTSTNDKSIFVHLEDVENLQKICVKLTAMTNGYIELNEKNRQLNRKVEQLDVQSKSQSLQKRKNDKIVVKQIEQLEYQLQEFTTANTQLQAKLNLKDKEKRKLQYQLKTLKNVCRQLETKVQQLERDIQESSHDNSEFALDYMTFQLQTLQTFFIRLGELTKFSSQMSNLLMIIYDDYQEISQVFREKLQIEYDLEELQQRYKSQKLSPQVQQHLLIQTRRQIQTFRLQLLKQKQIFRHKEQFIQAHFADYVKVNEAEMKIRNYSYQVENKLYRQKRNLIQSSEKPTFYNPTARDILTNRTKDHQNFTQDHPLEQQDNDNQQKVIVEKKTSLKFKHTNNAQEIMRQIIKKDKKNLQKILKQTRGTSTQVYINK